MAVSVVQVDFSDILAELEADKDLQETIREHQKELDRSSRAITTVLNKIHSTPSHLGELEVARSQQDSFISCSLAIPRSTLHRRADCATLCTVSECGSGHCGSGAGKSVLQGG